MMNKQKLLLTGAFLLVFSGGAYAQLDPSNRNTLFLYENGELVGEVYVPARSLEDPARYKEYWALYPGYRYPGLKYIGPLDVTPFPTEGTYADENEFIDHLERRLSAEGLESIKYIEVNVEESDVLPEPDVR